MRKWKQLLSMVLSASVCASLMSGFQPAVFAETTGVYEVHNGEMYYTIHDDGTAEITGFQRTSLSLEWLSPVIPEEIEGAAVTSIGDNAFKNGDAIISISIPVTITSIGENAFDGTFCQSVHYGGSYEQWNAIEMDSGNDLFLNAEIQYTADGFVYCILEDGTASISGYISDESSVIIPDMLDGFKVTQIDDYALNDKKGITEVTVSEGITRIEGGAFMSCEALTQIKLPDTLTELGERAFYGCSSLAEITLPDGISSIAGHTFHNCSSLSQVNLPEGITSIGEYAFYNCDFLQSIVLPDSVSTIGKKAFYECSRLVDISVPKNLSAIGENAFFCKWLDTLRLENGIAVVNNIIADGSVCTGDIIIPDSVTGIADGAFRGCTAESITVPGSVQYIGSGSFSGCTSLTNAVISEGVSALGNSMFSGCTALSDVSLPSTLRSVGAGAFADCTSLAEIDLNDGLISIGSSAFSDCTALTQLIIPDSVGNIGNNFAGGCYLIEKIVLPENLAEIPEKAFYQCRSLSDLTVPAGVVNISEDAFSECNIRMNIYYGGTETLWNDIYIAPSNNSILNRATIIYGSQTYTAGDLDGNDVIDLSDAQIVLGSYAQSAAGIGTGLQSAAADINGDGTVDLTDAGFILSYYAQNAAGMNPSWEDVIGA